VDDPAGFGVGPLEQAKQHSQDKPGRTGQGSVGTIGWAEAGLDGALVRFDHDRLLGGANLEGRGGPSGRSSTNIRLSAPASQ
jgi:hypothetical protein